MPEAMSSLEYWEERWGKDPWNFATSWPDGYARRLELAAVKKLLPPGRVLEVGCGNLQLAEDPDLLLDLSHRGYTGIDGARAALEVAKVRASQFSDMWIMPPTDIETQGFHTGHGDVVLAKRTIQNLAPDVQSVFLPFLRDAFDHGLLIEATQAGLRELNELRQASGIEELCTPPAYNWYLSDELLADLDVEVIPFMAHYYAETRGVRQLRTWDSEVHLEAYKESRKQLNEGKFEGAYGPVVALVW